MIRVTQTFTCQHPELGTKTVKPGLPVTVKTMGHSAVLDERVCFCTGAPLPMKREVKHNDPDPVLK